MICIKAPASLANLGPGFDVLAMAIQNPFDIVGLERIKEPNIIIEAMGPHGSAIPLDATMNVVEPVLVGAAKMAKYEGGFRVKIWKGIKPASGLGSSGADAAATAYGVTKLLGLKLSDWELSWLAAMGEAKAAGSPHMDNASASLFGGFIIINQELRRIIKLDTWDFPIILVTMGSKPSTQYMRSLLPRTVELRASVHNLAGLASLIHAVISRDLDLLGMSIEMDELATPYRAKAYDHLQRVKETLHRYGALGVALSGSGPSVFGVFREEPCIECIRRELGNAWVMLTRPSNSGAVEAECPSEFKGAP
ncbi:MAG: homoserine kinase [Thermocladium sp.]